MLCSTPFRDVSCQRHVSTPGHPDHHTTTLVSPQHFFPLPCAQSSPGPLGISLGWLSRVVQRLPNLDSFADLENAKGSVPKRLQNRLVGCVSHRRGLRHSFRWARFLDWAPKLLEMSLGSQRKRPPFHLKANVTLAQEVHLGRGSREHFYQYYFCVRLRLILLHGFHELCQNALGELYCYLVGSLRKWDWPNFLILIHISKLAGLGLNLDSLQLTLTRLFLYCNSSGQCSINVKWEQVSQ